MDTYSPNQSSVSSLKTFAWLVRREIWEHRAFWMVPAIVGAIILLTHISGLVQGVRHINLVSDMMPDFDLLAPSMVPVFGQVVMLALVAVFGIAVGIVSIFYLLDSLYGERRDRSVLFWKSLPITDHATVGSKFFTGVVVLPLIALAAAFVTYVLILLLLTLAFGFRDGFPLFGLWNPLLMIGSIAKWCVLTLSQQVWFLPFYAWLLFCSAFARKAPFLIAVFVPLGIMLAENLAYGASYLEQLLGNYVTGFFMVIEENSPYVGGGDIDFSTGEASVTVDTISVVDILQVFAQPQLYLGLAVAAAFLFATVWWRKTHVELG